MLSLMSAAMDKGVGSIVLVATILFTLLSLFELWLSVSFSHPYTAWADGERLSRGAIAANIPTHLSAS